MGELFIFVGLFLVVFFEELKFGQVYVSEIGGGFGSLEVVDGVLDLLVLLVLVDDWGFAIVRIMFLSVVVVNR